jgi:hypothetical protein
VRRIECRRCGKVKRERLGFLADNPLYTKRFAYYVAHACARMFGPLADLSATFSGLTWMDMAEVDVIRFPGD